MLRITINTQLISGAVATIEGDSPDTVHQALVYLHNIGQLKTDTPSPNADIPPEPANADTDETAKAAAQAADNAAKAEAVPEKPARKPRAKKEDKAAAPESEPETPAATEDKQPAPVKATAEDAAAAITAVANDKGLAAAKALLTVFKVKRAGELDPSQYDAFVKEATDLLKPADGEDAEESVDDVL